MKCRKQKLGQRFGFTLLELSMVIVIVSILIIAVSSGSRALNRSRVISAQSLNKSSPVLSTSNLIAWYETTSENSFKDADISSTQINTWYNLNPSLSVAANNALAPNTNCAPIYTKTAINGLPALFFNGTDTTTANRDYLTFDGTALANNDYTVIVVEERTGGNTDRTRFFVSGFDSVTSPDTLNNRVLMLGYDYVSSTDLIIFGQNSNDYQYNIEDFSVPVPRIHVFRFSSTIGKKYRLNGQDKTLVDQGGAVPTQGLISYRNAQIGRYSNSTNYLGYIGEIIIFNKYVNDDETQEIERYLNKKWRVY